MSFPRMFPTDGLAFLGVEPDTTGHGEKLISGAGALLGILAVYGLSRWVLGEGGATVTMVASMGATAVLLFGVPHSVLSQPWPLFGGNLFSAFIGVSCQKLFPQAAWTPALAVGAAVAGMYYLRCLHPPGGATALSAVIGGGAIHELGYGYVLIPVLLNVLAIASIAIAYNGFFAWRRYPSRLAKRPSAAPRAVSESPAEVTHEDFAAALQQMGSFIDIAAEDLADLFELAKSHARDREDYPVGIVAGRFYSNGRVGRYWSVRQVVDASDKGDPAKDEVIFKTVAGDGAYETGLAKREDFRRWARYEVVPEGRHWIRPPD